MLQYTHPMTIDGRFAAGIAFLAVVILSPGAAWALVAAVAARDGQRSAILTALGLASGILAWSAASGLGLALILAASPAAFGLVKTLGAVYLAYLGVRMIRRSGRSTTAPASSRRGFYARGLLTNLLNPQIAIFYLTFLPQFVVPGEPVLAKSLTFGVVHGTMVVGWFAVYAYGISSLATRIRQLQVVIARAGGLVLIGFSLWLILGLALPSLRGG